MPLWSVVALFFACLITSIGSSLVLGWAFDVLGTRLGFSEGLLGIVTALGADAPEISAAVVALIAGQHDIGLGVVLGSNIFNLAGLVGLSAVIAGRVAITRPGLLFEGMTALLVTVIAGALVFTVLTPFAGTILLLMVLVPYVLLSALRPAQLPSLHLRRAMEWFLREAIAPEHRVLEQKSARINQWRIAAVVVVPLLVTIVVASLGMVRAAVTLASRWGISDAIVGTVVLAALTSLPNAATALRLALHGRGTAVISETMNSNTFNVFAGICLPGLVLGLGSMTNQTMLSMGWLLGMTILTIAFAAMRNGFSHWHGMVVIALYLVFIGLSIAG